jgi:hypothetical protein
MSQKNVLIRDDNQQQTKAIATATAADNIVYDFVYMNDEQIRIKISETHLVLQKEITLKNVSINQILNETDLSIFLLQNDENHGDFQHFAFASSIMNYENNEKVNRTSL